MRRDQIGYLRDWVDVGGFQIALLDDAERGVAGHADIGLSGGRRLLKQVAAEGEQAGVVDEIGQGQLPNALRLRLAGNGGGDEAGLADGDRRRVLRHDDVGRHQQAVAGDELALRIGAERAVARIDGVAVGVGDLEPAPPVDGEVEGIAGRGQRALDIDGTDGGGAHAKADLRAFRHGGARPAAGDALQAFVLIDEIGEFGARALEAGGVDVRDIVRDHLDVLFLGAHARRRDRQRSHAENSFLLEPGQPSCGKAREAGAALRAPCARFPDRRRRPYRGSTAPPAACAARS